MLRDAYTSLHPGLYRYATPAQVAKRLTRLEGGALVTRRDWIDIRDVLRAAIETRPWRRSKVMKRAWLGAPCAAIAGCTSASW